MRVQQPSGLRMVAFFPVMYYAALRPQEAINLAIDNVILPPRVWDEDSQQWEEPPEDQDLGRTASTQRLTRRGPRVDRR